MFENDHVRVLEVRGETGTDLRPHSHPPRVVVAIGSYRMKSISTDGEEEIIDRRPGEAIWVEEERHSATVLVGPSHVIEVEIKSAANAGQVAYGGHVLEAAIPQLMTTRDNTPLWPRDIDAVAAAAVLVIDGRRIDEVRSLVPNVVEHAGRPQQTSAPAVSEPHSVLV